MEQLTLATVLTFDPLRRSIPTIAASLLLTAWCKGVVPSCRGDAMWVPIQIENRYINLRIVSQ